MDYSDYFALILNYFVVTKHYSSKFPRLIDLGCISKPIQQDLFLILPPSIDAFLYNWYVMQFLNQHLVIFFCHLKFNLGDSVRFVSIVKRMCPISKISLWNSRFEIFTSKFSNLKFSLQNSPFKITVSKFYFQNSRFVTFTS